MPSRYTRNLKRALTLAAVLAVTPAAAETIVEANVKLIEPYGVVPVARIPEGVYLRSVDDPDDIIWERLPEYRVTLYPAPPVHDSVFLRHDPDLPPRDVIFAVARTDGRFYVRLRWRDGSDDSLRTRDRFVDGVAVQFSMGDDTTSYMMGTGPEEPVNIWYWAADSNAAQSLGAGGPGSTTLLDSQPVTADSRYVPSDTPEAGQWVVVMSRPLSEADLNQVNFDRDELAIAFALWQGENDERDGLKSVSDGWILVDQTSAQVPQ